MRSKLTFGDLPDLSDDRMINDATMNVFQKLIKAANPTTVGLEDTILGQKKHFSVHRSTPFVQILHTGSAHWVVISTYGCDANEVVLVDTLFRGRITLKLKHQICEILYSTLPEIKVKVAPVQQQGASLDCGPFAIAYANFIAQNKCDPSHVSFDQSKLRSHMLKILKDNKISDFPISANNVKRCPRK